MTPHLTAFPGASRQLQSKVRPHFRAHRPQGEALQVPAAPQTPEPTLQRTHPRTRARHTRGTRHRHGPSSSSTKAAGRCVRTKLPKASLDFGGLLRTPDPLSPRPDHSETGTRASPSPSTKTQAQVLRGQVQGWGAHASSLPPETPLSSGCGRSGTGRPSAGKTDTDLDVGRNGENSNNSFKKSTKTPPCPLRDRQTHRLPRQTQPQGLPDACPTQIQGKGPGTSLCGA